MSEPENTEKPNTAQPSAEDKASLLAGLLGQLKELSITAPTAESVAADIGPATPNKEPQIDIVLYPSREVPIAGELWSVSAEVHNRDQFPIWLIDNTSCLSLAPEMYGQAVSTGSIGAFLPTIQQTPFPQLIRIDPNSKYTLVWKLDPLSGDERASLMRSMSEAQKKPDATKRTLLRRIKFALRNYMFFIPGEFRVACTCHVWAVPPKIEGKRVANMGESFPMTVSRDIEMEASPWVLIFGAAAGAALCFLLQIMLGKLVLEPGFWTACKAAFVGLGSATILAGVATVLLARLATTDFLVVIRIRDFWGAIATGFTIQWLGYGLIDKILK